MAKGKQIRKAPSGQESVSGVLIWDKQNYLWIGIGFVLIILGLLLMTGGAMDSPEEWDSGKIYSFRRVTLAPTIILVGLVIEIYAIFKKSS